MCEHGVWQCLSTFINELLHYHVIILYSYTDVDWCSDRECEDTGLRYVCLPALLDWCSESSSHSCQADFVTSVYHHYHSIKLCSFTDVDWCM